MSRARLALPFAALLALAPSARAEDPKPPPPPPPPVPHAPADAHEEAAARLRAELAELKLRIDEARAARDAAREAGEEQRVRLLEGQVGELERKILAVKDHLHALEGGRPLGPDEAQARALASWKEIQAALARARAERKAADARGDAAAEAAAKAKIAELERRAAEFKASHPDLPAALAAAAVKARGPQVAKELAEIQAALEHARAERKAAEERGDAEGVAAAKAKVGTLERRAAELKTALLAVGVPEHDAALREDRVRLAAQAAEIQAALEHARAERAAADARGDAAAEAAAKAKMEALERRMALLVAGHPDLRGLPPHAGRPGIEAAQAEIGAALDRARAECKAAEARGDAAAAEAARQRIGALEEKAAAMKRGAAPGAGVPHPEVLRFHPLEGDPALRRLRALRDAARILREGGMPDRAEMLEHDAANLEREIGGHHASPPTPGDDDLRRQIADLREEVRQLRLLIQNLSR